MTFVNHCGGWGWIWHIPTRESTSVGIVVAVEDYKRDVAIHSSLDYYFMAARLSTRFLGGLLARAKRVNGPLRMTATPSYLPENVVRPRLLRDRRRGGLRGSDLLHRLCNRACIPVNWPPGRSLFAQAAGPRRKPAAGCSSSNARPLSAPAPWRSRCSAGGGAADVLQLFLQGRKGADVVGRRADHPFAKLVDLVTPGAEPVLRIRQLDTLQFNETVSN